MVASNIKGILTPDESFIGNMTSNFIGSKYQIRDEVKDNTLLKILIKTYVIKSKVVVLKSFALDVCYYRGDNIVLQLKNQSY